MNCWHIGVSYCRELLVHPLPYEPICWPICVTDNCLLLPIYLSNSYGLGYTENFTTIDSVVKNRKYSLQWKLNAPIWSVQSYGVDCSCWQEKHSVLTSALTTILPPTRKTAPLPERQQMSDVSNTKR